MTHYTDLSGAEWIDKHLPGVDLTGMTFREIAAKYGEETAIHAGIAADPEWGPDEMDMSKEHISLRLDADLVEYFRNSGRGWQTRLNAMLRRSVFGDG